MSTGSSSKVTRSSLLYRARQRDAVAWRELVDLYGPLILAWCRRCGLDDHSAADCLQDVLASVALGLDSFEPTGNSGAFRAWLWTITRRKVIDALRKSQRTPRALGGSSAAGMFLRIQDHVSVPDEEPSDEFHVRELVDRALSQVRNEFEDVSWNAFWRSVVDGLPTEIVAAELKSSPAAVRQARSRILRRLRQQLGDV